jgi:hypothetical protein
MNKDQAEKYWKENIQFKEFQGNGQEVTKMVQSIQISPEIEWGLPANSKYAKHKPIYETNTFQDKKYSNSRTTPNEKRLCNLLRS